MTQRVPDIDRRRNHLSMQLVSARTVPFLDSLSLAPRLGREALFRANDDRFILYLADGNSSQTREERVIFLDLREALIWLNEPSEQRSSFWT